jgi:hypothetical protein
MAQTYPKYVRLADHLSRGMRADLNSGFSLSGYNVVESPDEETEAEAAAFVKRELAAGRMEGASKAEFDEVHPDLLDTLGYEVERKVSLPIAPQEGHIQREVRGAHRAMRAGRSTEAGESAFEADEARREALIEDAKEAESGSKRGKKAKAGAEASQDDSAGSAGQQ